MTGLDAFPIGEVIKCDHCHGAYTAGSTEPCPARYQGREVLHHEPVDPRDYDHYPEHEVTGDEAARLRELAREVRGFPLHTFGIGAPPSDDAARAAAALVADLTERFPVRPERLLVLSRVTAAITAARDALLTELIEGQISWGHYARHCHACGAKFPDARREDGHSWRGSVPDSYDVEHLATLTGLSTQAIRARIKKVQMRFYAEAEAAYATLHPDTESPTG